MALEAGAKHARTATLRLPILHAMTSDLPYAADAEVSLSYDELEVPIPRSILRSLLSLL